MSRLLIIAAVILAGILGYRLGKRSSTIPADLPQMKALNGACWRWKPVVLIPEEAFRTKLPLFVQQEDETISDAMERYAKWASSQPTPLDTGGRIIARNPKWENGQWEQGYPPFKYWNQQDFGGTLSQNEYLEVGREK